MSSGVATTDLLTHLLADATLEEAYAWLCTQRQDYSHNSDVWALRQHWSEVKDGMPSCSRRWRSCWEHI